MVLDRSGRTVVGALFLATGLAALVTQVTWQRVIALHSGVDLSSSVIVVTAFLAGLGIGSLLGGRIADRLDGRRAVGVLALAYLVVAGYCAASTWLLYDLYRSVAGSLEAAPVRFAFNAALLLVPTVLQGMSLPLVARAVVDDPGRAGSTIGRFNAANTLGAALGAAVGGWYLLGAFGFRGTTVVAGAVYVFVALVLAAVVVDGPAGRVAAAVAVVVAAAVSWVVFDGDDALAPVRIPGALAGLALGALLAWGALRATLRAPAEDVGPAPVGAPADRPDAASVTHAAPPTVARGWWFLLYGITGAVAVGFELVFFRVVDGIMRSNTYTFAHVLSLYLGLLAVGTALGSVAARRVTDLRRGFLWAQFGVGASALGSALLVIEVLPRTLLEAPAARWFESDGFAAGFGQGSTADQVTFGLVVPFLLLAVPVLLMGASFPFVQGLVSDELGRLGSATGGLTASNLAGNVIGGAVTGFVLIEHLGSAGTYQVLFLPLAVAGVLAALLTRRPARRWVEGGTVVLASALLLVAFPNGEHLWAVLHSTTTDEILVAEDRSCASAVELYGDDALQLTINGAGQNGHPYDDFHVLIGLLPALVHPDPQHGLAIGLGIGSTSAAMLSDPAVDDVTSVELCGGNYELVDRLADRGIADFVRLRDDPRHHEVTGDGRRYLLVHDDRFDLVVPDTMRPNSAGSGNLYSREFAELVDSRLTDDGIAAGWVPSARAHNAVATTYPYVVTATIPAYNDSQLYLASRSPIVFDRDEVLRRFDALPDGIYPAEQRARLREFLKTVELDCVNDGQVAQPPSAAAENRDLHPRDEYVLTNDAVEGQIVGTCLDPN